MTSKPLKPGTTPIKNLFVLSGGGLRGLDILTGLLSGLHYRGITPSAIIGTSAGAIIAALHAAGHSPSTIEFILRGLSDSHVRRERFMWKPRALWLDHFLENQPIRALLKKLLPEKLPLTIPYACVTTRVRDGAETIWTVGGSNDLPGIHMQHLPDWRECVLASMSVSGVFPWVNLGGEWHCDGGTRANLPLPDTWHDYDAVYLLIASPPAGDFTESGRSIFSRLILNLDFYALDQIKDVIARIRRSRRTSPSVYVIWPNIAGSGGFLRFDHRLIDKTFTWAALLLNMDVAKINT